MCQLIKYVMLVTSRQGESNVTLGLSMQVPTNLVNQLAKHFLNSYLSVSSQEHFSRREGGGGEAVDREDSGDSSTLCYASYVL